MLSTSRRLITVAVMGTYPRLYLSWATLSVNLSLPSQYLAESLVCCKDLIKPPGFLFLACIWPAFHTLVEKASWGPGRCWAFLWLVLLLLEGNLILPPTPPPTTTMFLCGGTSAG